MGAANYNGCCDNRPLLLAFILNRSRQLLCFGLKQLRCGFPLYCFAQVPLAMTSDYSPVTLYKLLPTRLAIFFRMMGRDFILSEICNPRLYFFTKLILPALILDLCISCIYRLLGHLAYCIQFFKRGLITLQFQIVKVLLYR